MAATNLASALETMANAGVTSNNLGGMALIEVIPLLRSEQVLDAIRGVIRAVFEAAGEPVVNTNPRVLGASFMIALHRNHCFEVTNNIETIQLQDAVFESAKEIVERLEALRRTPEDQLTKDFFAPMMEYFKRFKEWKVPDHDSLVIHIEQTLLALDEACAQIEVDNTVRLEFEHLKERLSTKLSQMDPATFERYVHRRDNNN